MAAIAAVALAAGVLVVAAPVDAQVGRTQGELVRYDFGEGSGSTVGDSGSGVPLDLTIGNVGNVSWVSGGGLRVDASTTIKSAGAASKVIDAVKASGELTLEAWVVPAAGVQSGPARILSNSADPFGRNFLLGQGAYSNLPNDVFSLRTRTTSSVGGTPELFTPSGSAVPLALTHVVSTRNASGQRVTYVNGAQVASDTLAGTTANWVNSYPLTIANEATGDRPWLGTLCLVAIYDTALDATEVANNYNAGCDLPAPPASALVQVTPGGALGATTFGNSTISVSNTGVAGSPAITGVFFDVRGSLIPDATFDPIGTAGDEGTQCLAVSAGAAATGFVAPGDPCTDPFSLPHEDDPGVPANGWDGMSLDFTDFGVGEQIVFGVDVDPTSIQGVPGAGGAGAVSGLELSGSSVTVTFSDGQVLTNQLFGDGSAGGGQAVVSSVVGQVAPTGIEMLGVTTAPTVFPNNSQAGNVAAVGDQTVRVSGPEGATVELLAVTGELQSPAPFDEDPYESDAAVAVGYQSGTIVGGFVDFTVSQPDEAALYHYVAAIDDGATGLLTEQLVIGIGDVDTPLLDPIADIVVDEGDQVSVAINATDPNGDPVTLGLASTPDIEALGAVLTDNGDGTGSLDWTTEAGDAGTYTVDVTATDGANTATETFTITITDPNAGPPASALVQVTPGGGVGCDDVREFDDFGVEHGCCGFAVDHGCVLRCSGFVDSGCDVRSDRHGW